MNQKELSEALTGKTISKITFKENAEDNTAIESITLVGGELLTLSDTGELSHPEKEEEVKAFYEVLKNIPPSGLITFKAKYLSQGLIDRKISATGKKIKANGFGQRNSTRQDHLTYRFDMPEN